MRWAFLPVALLLIGCEFHTDCDEHIKALYPNSTIETLDIDAANGSDLVLYWRDREQFVLCDYGHAQLEVDVIPVSPWDEVYCKQFTNPPACKEQLKKGTLP